MPETLLGFDFGTRRIGIAIGQTLTGSARPLTTLDTRNGKPDWEAIGRLIREWQPDRLVVGLPLHLDGTPQSMTEQARRFGRQLEGRYNLPVEWVDERLTSDAAERELPSPHDKGAVDAMAAALILEDWLAQHA
ncbi:MAG TPA: Holliday junction resolvase RuvX [Gammaproteobacteria bacterium]|nr:Holliday junction resolvase RuvX [Gammaproteobacteria bacterium]